MDALYHKFNPLATGNTPYNVDAELRHIIDSAKLVVPRKQFFQDFLGARFMRNK